MTDGTLVEIMNDEVLDSPTQDGASQNLGLTPKPQDTKIPSGMYRRTTDGTLRMRVGRPRNTHRGFRPTSPYYDLKFKGGRRYKITFTSLSQPDISFSVDHVATSLRNLLVHVAHEIGKTRKTRAARQFTVTFEAQPDGESIVETNVGVPFAEPLQGDDRPLTVLPSFDEDLAL